MCEVQPAQKASVVSCRRQGDLEPTRQGVVSNASSRLKRNCFYSEISCTFTAHLSLVAKRGRQSTVRKRRRDGERRGAESAEEQRSEEVQWYREQRERGSDAARARGWAQYPLPSGSLRSEEEKNAEGQVKCLSETISSRERFVWASTFRRSKGLEGEKKNKKNLVELLSDAPKNVPLSKINCIEIQEIQLRSMQNYHHDNGLKLFFSGDCSKSAQFPHPG